MPHKFNADWRLKIARWKHRVTNWIAHSESLQRRGDLTIWVNDEVLCLRSASRRSSRDGQQKYSDLAITLCLTLRVVYSSSRARRETVDMGQVVEDCWILGPVERTASFSARE
ncbi:transposase [Rhizobium sp. 2YAF20]|uniref:transposase n=1 Tax=Rhizobium sp. 2YAF20 TaxID=3233027 RepID=UPI003F99C46A